ncbi:MAG: SusC/RagA family TonB-linked outer membrane protein [Tannerellaceae bacterium]
MKIVVLILWLLTSVTLAEAQQRVAEVSITIQTPKRIVDVLDEIEKQTEYSFVYDARVIDLSAKISTSLNGNLFELLHQLFKNTDIAYTIIADQIILNKKETLIRIQQQSFRKVNGVVTDEKGVPVIGANIIEKETTNGSTTDLNGRFVVNIPQKTVLHVSYIGYNPQDIVYNGQSFLRIKLTENTQQLEEVVVTALGLCKKESSLAYATQLIAGEELTRNKELNLINTLTGKLAGVQINKTSSGLIGSAKVIIRGSRSVSGNNQPLYVVDGVPMLNSISEQAMTIIGGTADAGNRDGGDGISNLNPDDIESLNILKGASAAALYGAQAANGVILITTKRGVPGVQRMQFSSTLTVDHAISLPKFQNDYGKLDGSAESWGEKALLPAYDNTRDFFRNGLTAVNAISFMSGNEKTQSYFSYANATARGIIDKNSMNKHNLNLRETSSFFNKRLTLDGNVNLMTQYVKNEPAIGGFYMNPLNGLYTFPRGMDITPYKDNFELFSDKRNMQVQNWYTAITDFDQNPYWLVNRIESRNRRARVLASLSVNLKVTDWLTLLARGNVDYIHDKFRQKIYASTSPGIAGVNGRYIDIGYQETQLYGDVMAMMDKKWKEFSLNVAIGASITDNRVNSLRLDSKTASLYFPNVFTVSNINMSTSAYINEQNDARRQMQSVFATAQVGYKESLYLDVSARNDWSSTLAYTQSNRSGFFYPSVGASLVLRPLMKRPEHISFGKLRASLSKVGNDIPLFVSNTVGHISAGGSTQPAAVAPFSDLKPEMSTSFEVGTEWRFLNNRLDVDFTYYLTNTKNQLFTLPSSAGAIYKYYFVNAGNIQNTGIELSISAIPIVSNRFQWKSTVNYSQNRNRVKELHKDLLAFVYGDEGFSSSYSLRLVEGGSFGDIYGKAFARDSYGAIRYGQDGLPLVVGDGNTVKVGNCNPNFMLSWGNAFTYRDFSFYFLLDGRFGGKVLSQTQAILDQSGVSDVSGKARLAGYVDLEGHPIYNTRMFYEQIGGRSGVTEYYMYDATNIRLRELSLGYTLPADLLPKSEFIKQVQLSFVARNLLFIYKKAPFDPDAVLSTSNSNQGVDVLGIPTTRSMGFTIKLIF